MDLHLHEMTQLTCVRGGGCCHAQHLPVTPWEIAVLAADAGMSAIAFRDQYTVDGGTRLLADGPADVQGRPACSLLTATGCSRQDARPLACRLFPLGRRLNQGQPVYHLPDTAHPCSALCPSFALQPLRRVDAWLAEQGVAMGESVHDAYGRLVCGLLLQAGQNAAQQLLFPELIHQRIAMTAGQRILLLTPPWFDLLTAPDLAVFVDHSERFVHAHAQCIIDAVIAQHEDDLQTALLLATVAMQLGQPLGIQPEQALGFATARGVAHVA